MPKRSIEMSEEYMGWANYETWAVSLVINNDESGYHAVMDWAKDLAATGTSRADIKERLVNALRGIVEEDFYGALAAIKSPVAEQLCRKVNINCIDYDRIAETFLDEDIGAC